MIDKGFLTGLIIIIFFILGFNLNISPLQADNQLNKIDGDQLSFTFDSLNYQPVLVVAQGNAALVYGDINLRGEKIEYNFNSGAIKAEGKTVLQAVFNQQDHTVKADQMAGKLEEEELYFTGNVSLENEELLITAASLAYQKETGRIVLKGRAGVQPVLNYYQSGITATAAVITLIPDEERALLAGNASGEGDGFSFVGDELTIDLVAGDIMLSGNARFRFAEQGEA